MAQVKSLNCPNCGDSIPDTSKACPSCGSRVILSDDRQKFVLAGTICQKCGLDNKEQHRFCSKCGEKLVKECPKCHKEIGLESVHCPFCGNNLDTAAKEREMELTRYKEVLSQLEFVEQKVKQLEQTLEIKKLKDKTAFPGKECESIKKEIQEKNCEITALRSKLIYIRNKM